jgi:acetyl-CoA carboxylase carboxyl transferase subunit beta
MVDMVVHRHHMRETLSRLLRLLSNQPPAGIPAVAEAEEPESEPVEAEPVAEEPAPEAEVH